MAERTYRPRKVELETLVKTLVEEHGVMKNGLARVKAASDRRDYKSVAAALQELDPIFRQHIVDEESQILRLLVSQLGVEGAREEIRVFQQHRPIYRLMQSIGELASKSALELQDEPSRLEVLFEQPWRRTVSSPKR
jgi:hypothetical protein